MYILAQTEPIREIRPQGIRGWDTETAFVNLNVRREPFTLLNGNVHGYATRNRTVAINPVARRPKSVLFHELGHIVLGHHRKDNSFHTEGSDAKRKTLHAASTNSKPSVYRCCVGRCRGFSGLKYSFGYIRSWWPKGRRVPKRSVQRIFRATEMILNAGRVA